MSRVSAHMSSGLRKSHGRRSFPVRKGDKVKITRGSFKGEMGKVVEVNSAKGVVQVEGLARKKADGSKLTVEVHASNVEIIELELSDEWRKKALKRGEKK